MKKLILQTNEAPGSSYQLYAELHKVGNLTQLKFTSVWTEAKDPGAPQNKFETYLTDDARSNLRELLGSKL